MSFLQFITIYIFGLTISGHYGFDLGNDVSFSTAELCYEYFLENETMTFDDFYDIVNHSLIINNVHYSEINDTTMAQINRAWQSFNRKMDETSTQKPEAESKQNKSSVPLETTSDYSITPEKTPDAEISVPVSTNNIIDLSPVQTPATQNQLPQKKAPEQKHYSNKDYDLLPELDEPEFSSDGFEYIPVVNPPEEKKPEPKAKPQLEELIIDDLDLPVFDNFPETKETPSVIISEPTATTSVVIPEPTAEPAAAAPEKKSSKKKLPESKKAPVLVNDYYFFDE